MSSTLTSALNISRLLPTNRLEDNINAISELLYNDDDALNAFLQKIEQPLVIHNSGFICCEYNRDGDSYRRPGSNDYYPNIEDGVKLDEELLKLERILNNIFKEYYYLYFSSVGSSTFSSNGNSNVYCFQYEKNNTSEFAVAVLIKNEIIDRCNKINKSKWEAIHLIKVSEDMGDCSYEIISTINLSLNIKTIETLSDVVLTGTINKTKKVRQEFEERNKNYCHTRNIGELVESMENDLKSKLENIYLNKTNQIIRDLRVV